MPSPLARTPNLFWRTFILLMFLIVFCVMGWLQSFRVLNETPYVQATAQQIVSMAKLTRYALISADPVYRSDLLLVLANQEGLRILPKEPTDTVVPLSQGASYASSIEDIKATVRYSLGAGTVLAERVNGEPGLWVSFTIDGDAYWLRTNATILNPPYGKTWLWWALAAFVASILCAVLITSRLTAPLNQLSLTAREFGRGRVPKTLPEDSGPEEIRELNASFNRMVQDITRVEKDREVLLAGVSHDLRTPITRLRLETELADLPEDTHRAMVSDLEQMERIVNQFMDYARRNSLPLAAVDLSRLVSDAVRIARIDIDPGVRLRVSIDPDIWVMA
ncbi:MAG TPA: sensor histidine kinase, partial [Sutterella sp.]|nr:sensor histidine kinase [Sutterella sp.]